MLHSHLFLYFCNNLTVVRSTNTYIFKNEEITYRYEECSQLCIPITTSGNRKPKTTWTNMKKLFSTLGLKQSILTHKQASMHTANSLFPLEIIPLLLPSSVSFHRTQQDLKSQREFLRRTRIHLPILLSLHCHLSQNTCPWKPWKYGSSFCSSALLVFSSNMEFSSSWLTKACFPSASAHHLMSENIAGSPVCSLQQGAPPRWWLPWDSATHRSS